MLLFYTKSDEWTWNLIYTPHDQAYIDHFYRSVEPGSGRRYGLWDERQAAHLAGHSGQTDRQLAGARLSSPSKNHQL